jgi:hypothetical protein
MYTTKEKMKRWKEIDCAMHELEDAGVLRVNRMF